MKSLFNKITESQSASLLEKRLLYRYFQRNFAKFLRTPIFTEQIGTTAFVKVCLGIFLFLFNC